VLAPQASCDTIVCFPDLETRQTSSERAFAGSLRGDGGAVFLTVHLHLAMPQTST